MLVVFFFLPPDKKLSEKEMIIAQDMETDKWNILITSDHNVMKILFYQYPLNEAGDLFFPQKAQKLRKQIN